MLGAWHEVWSQLTADISTRHEVWSQLTADISTREPLPLCTRRVHRVGTWQSDAEGHNQHASVNDCTHFCLHSDVTWHWLASLIQTVRRFRRAAVAAAGASAEAKVC